MKNFKYNTQTACFCGNDCIKENAAMFPQYGEKAAIITSKFADGCRNYALEDTSKALACWGIKYIIIDSVMENPPVESVVALAKQCHDFGADFIIAIGGGSAIDSAKAVSLLLTNPGKAPYDVFYAYSGPSDSIKTESDVPVFAVPTTAGTGAEVTGFAVLTRSDTDTKLSMYPLVFCQAAFLDPRYICQSPLSLLQSGAMDTLAHGVETYLHVDSNIINRSISEIGFKLFSQYKEALLHGELDMDDFQKMQTASFVMGMAFMQSSTTIPHGMGYPLSHYKGVNHGIACAAFLGEYLKGFKDQSLVQPIVNACEFENSQAFSEYISKIISANLHISVSMEEIEKWTDDFMKLDFRLASTPEKLSREDIRNIYIRSLSTYIES